MTPISDTSPRSEAPSADIAGRAADPGGGGRWLVVARCGGSDSRRSQRYRINSSAAGNAAPAPIRPVMSNTHTGVLHVASSPVTSTQNTLANPKNRPSRSAHLRLRSSRARGSATLLSR